MVIKRSNLVLCMLGASLIAPAVMATTPRGTSMGITATQTGITVKGNVSDAAGPLIGVSVKVVGTSKGVITDLDGNFTLQCNAGDELEISYVGYKTVRVKAQNILKIKLEQNSETLDEVVVTALGIKRDRKALGYGLSEIKGAELTKANETNVMNSLAGKVAGLVVTNTAGGAAGSTRVMLRGTTELTGNNQPLYVIDGVPLDNTNFGSAGEQGGYDLGDGISAINPDDIETMTVLKGPAASALYGSRASHGVILITTKKAGKEKFSVEYNGSLTIDTQLAKWDDVQEIYGMGDNGQYQLDASSGTNSSWGVKADMIDKTYFDGSVRPFLMYPNNTSSFFRTGLTAQNSAILSVNTGKTGVRFTFTDMRNKDILPNSHMSRDNFNLRVTTSAGPVDFDFTANYVRENVKNRPALSNSQSNVGKNLMTLAGTYNVEWLKNYQNADGTYAISASSGDVLVFSVIGYKSAEAAVENDRAVINMALEEDAEMLEETVVVGYGTMDKKELTSAISHISSEDFLVTGGGDPAMLIQGKVAGVSITNTGVGNPNSTASIQIRGISSRKAGLEPLIVIDGIAGGDLANLNQNDIESIDILKDGAASAIYGTRGSNGVIQITTKKGSQDAYPAA